MYPIDPGVVIRLAVTPSLPFDLVPTGQFGIVLAPTDFPKSALIALRCCENTNEVPLLSARTTTLIGASGSFAPGLLSAMAGSFHFLIVPTQIPAYALRDSFKASTSFMLYASTMLPAVIGKSWTPPASF